MLELFIFDDFQAILVWQIKSACNSITCKVPYSSNCCVVTKKDFMPLKTAQLSHYFVTGSEILAALTPTIINTTDSALRRFEPLERDCYVDDEFPLPNLNVSEI